MKEILPGWKGKGEVEVESANAHGDDELDLVNVESDCPW